MKAAAILTATLMITSMGIPIKSAMAAAVTVPPQLKRTYTKATVKWPKLSATSPYAFAVTCGKTANVCATVTPARMASKMVWADPASVLTVTAGTDPSCNGGQGGLLTVGAPATDCVPGQQTISAKLNGKVVSTAQGVIFDFVGTLTPDDNFAGRNQDKYGIAETVTFGVTISPAGISAAEIGGLQWKKETGGVGTVSSSPDNDGTGSFDAGPTPGNVTLRLEGQSGPAQAIARSYPKTITAPTGNNQTIIPNTVVAHTKDTVSVGFKTFFFILPKEVSFKNIRAREGTGTATASGIYAAGNGAQHGVSSHFPISNCNITTGCQWQNTSNTGPQPDFVAMCPRTPLADNTGEFVWPISNDYIVGTQPPVSYATAIHRGVSDTAGRVCLSKAGQGPDCKSVADPTSQQDVFFLCQ